MNGAYRVADLPQLETCPHCGGATVTETSATLRFVCGACGGARVPGVAAGELDRRTIAGLRAARRALAWMKWKQAAAVPLSFLVLLLTLTVAARDASVVGLLGIVASMAALFWWFLVGLAPRQTRTRVRDLLDEAWADAAVTIAASHGGALTARELTETTRIPLADAERILAKLSLRGARVDLADDAELHYRIDDVRVDDLRVDDVVETAPPREARR